MNYNKFIGHLPANITTTQLEAHCIIFGPVTRLSLPVDTKAGRLKGHAFVEFEFEGDARHCIENLHDSELQGNVLKCSLAQGNQANRAVWDKDYHDQDLETYGDDEGQVIDL